MPFFVEQDPFKEVSALLSNPQDYFDFPSTLIAFARSLGSSDLFIYKNCFFRKRNRHLTLITFLCSGSELLKIISELSTEYKIKTLNFAGKDIGGVKTTRYGKEFFIDSDWRFADAVKELTSKKRNARTRKIRAGEKLFYPGIETLGLEEVMDVFDSWVSSAKARHFMVVKGHYLEYIKRYFKEPNNVHMLGFREKETKKLHGICGFEIHQNQAQITLMKHRIHHNFFPLYFWVKSIETIIEQYEPSKIYCGSTADKLKEDLGFHSTVSWKVIL